MRRTDDNYSYKLSNVLESFKQRQLSLSKSLIDDVQKRQETNNNQR